MKSRFIVLIGLGALLSACGGGANQTPSQSVPLQNPVPGVTTISPSSVPHGSAAFTLTVNGTNFVGSSTVRWNGSDRPTVFVSVTQLTATIAAADVANSGPVNITVSSPGPGGGTSNAATLTVTSSPVITLLSPSKVLVGSAAFTLTVNGSNFTSASVVRWNSSDRTTSFLSATQLSILVPSTDVAAAGTVTISVADPTGTSSPLTFTVENPLPLISTITPSAAVVGGGAFTLTVTGSDFVPTSVVLWNGSSRSTTYVNSGVLTAAILASDLTTTGSPNITVFTPSPGGGTSNSLPIVIAAPNPVPTIATLTPTTGTTGAANATLTVDGTNFVSNSVVQVNGSGRATSFTSNTRLTSTLTAFELAQSGTLSVTVFTPAPGGGTSNALPFAVLNPTPTLTALDPPSAIAGDAPLQLELTGSGYISDSVVEWNGQPHAATIASGTTMLIPLSAADLAAAAAVPVKVTNATPGGGASQTLNFIIAVRTSNPQPLITQLTDSQAPAGWPGLSLEVTGSGFVAASLLRFNGALRSTVALSASRLRAAIPPADLTSAGAAMVTVENGAPGGGTSPAASFTIVAVPVGTLGVIQRASTNTVDFLPGNDASYSPSVSADGRYVAFESSASNLVPGDNNQKSDVFLRDTCMGAAPGCTPSVTLVSVNDLGQQGDQPSYQASVSANGRYVAFASTATNLPGGTTNGQGQIYVRDTCLGASGCVPSTKRITPNGSTADSSSPSLSADGRYLSYIAWVGTGSARIADTCMGAAPGCAVSVVTSVDSLSEARLSGNGRYLVFSSDNSALVAGDTNLTTDIFLHDSCIGVASGCTPATTRVSVGANGEQANDYSFFPAVSPDGRFISFSSWATNLVPNDASTGHQVYLRDTCRGVASGCTPTTLRISVSDGGEQARSGGPSTGGATVSADGRYVAFGSNRSVLTANDTNGTFDIFLRDTCIGAPAGCTLSTKRVSVALNGTQGSSRSDVPVISSDGRFVAFQSAATTLAPGSTPSNLQIYLASTGRP